jgi:hypothetical protein
MLNKYIRIVWIQLNNKKSIEGIDTSITPMSYTSVFGAKQHHPVQKKISKLTICDDCHINN